jgi:hypothetical protein
MRGWSGIGAAAPLEPHGGGQTSRPVVDHIRGNDIFAHSTKPIVTHNPRSRKGKHFLKVVVAARPGFSHIQENPSTVGGRVDSLKHVERISGYPG